MIYSPKVQYPVPKPGAPNGGLFTRSVSATLCVAVYALPFLLTGCSYSYVQVTFWTYLVPNILFFSHLGRHFKEMYTLKQGHEFPVFLTDHLNKYLNWFFIVLVATVVSLIQTFPCTAVV